MQSWSYEKPINKRVVPSQPYSIVPQPPPVGFSAFTGRKCKYIQTELKIIYILTFRSLSKTSCSRSTWSWFVKLNQFKYPINNLFDLAMVHSTLSTHSEAVQQPRTVSHKQPKIRPDAEIRMLLI